MTEQEIAVRAIVETLRYLATTDDDARLRAWADTVERISVAARRTFVCCPFCAEVDCDDDCPLRHWPRGTYGWQNVPDEAHHVVLDDDGFVVGYAAPVEHGDHGPDAGGTLPA